MTRYTKNRRYPYPISRERAAGALDIERFVREFDRDAKATDLAWQGDLVRPSFTETGSDTGIPNGTDWALSTSATEYSIGSPDLDVDAYWLIDVNVGLTCSGAVTANSARTLKVNISESQTGGLVLVEAYICQDLQADGTVWLSTEFVTLFNRPRFIDYVVNHGNVGSTVNATLRTSFTQLMLA